MNPTELRIRELLIQQFDELEGTSPEDLSFEDTDLSAMGINSLAGVAFLKVVGKEFNVEIPPAKAAGFESLQDLVAYIDDHKT